MVGGTSLGEEAEDLVDLLGHVRWDHAVEHEADFRDPQDPVDLFDVAFDVGGDVLSGADVTRFQRAGESARQSACDAGDDMVEGRRVLGAAWVAPILVAVERPYAAVHTKVDGGIEALESGGAMGSLVFGDE